MGSKVLVVPSGRARLVIFSAPYGEKRASLQNYTFNRFNLRWVDNDVLYLFIYFANFIN